MGCMTSAARESQHAEYSSSPQDEHGEQNPAFIAYKTPVNSWKIPPIVNHELLCAAYCRKIMPDVGIPNDVLSIIEEFTCPSGEWSGDLKGQHISISGTKEDIITCESSTEHQYVQTNKVNSRHSVNIWKLKILKFIPPEPECRFEKILEIGVSGRYESGAWTCISATYSHDGTRRFHSHLTGDVQQKYGVVCTEGDIITVKVFAQVVAFSVSGLDQGAAFPRNLYEESNEYRLFVTMIGAGTSVQILSYYECESSDK